MDFAKLSSLLSGIEDNTVYLRFEPEILDFTDLEQSFELQFFTSQKQFSLVLNKEHFQNDSAKFVFEILRQSLFSKGKKVLTWNWKSLSSFILGTTGKIYTIDAAIVDLKILEHYSGQRLKPPKSLPDALNRLKGLITSGIWKEVEHIYKKLHLPLMTNVLPNLETVGIINLETQNKVYAHYEMEGQENGRLKSFSAYKHSYVPHSMSPEFRENLKANRYDDFFMSFDFKGMEVYMLAWMSKDPWLCELCKMSDVYVGIYEKLFEKKCESKNDRDLSKKIFLPVIYGQSAYSLSLRCGLAIDVTEMIVNRMHSLFSVALNFVESYQKQLKELGYAKDIFGRRRYSFEEGKEYVVRNFSVQSPASIVCLEKLSHLYFALKEKTDIVYSVVDGYVVFVNKENFKAIQKIGVDILTSESEFCPGLRLRVTCRAGKSLNNLKLLALKD